MPDYLDTSAFIKLVRSEPESAALRAEIAAGAALVSSALLVVEGRRAAARYGSLALARARAALATITLLALDDATLESAAGSSPPSCDRSTRCTSRRRSRSTASSGASSATTRDSRPPRPVWASTCAAPAERGHTDHRATPPRAAAACAPAARPAASPS